MTGKRRLRRSIRGAPEPTAPLRPGPAVAGAYLVIFCFTLAYLAATSSSNAASGVPAILITLPWSSLLADSLNAFLRARVAPMTAGILTLCAGALLNAAVLFAAGSLIERLGRGKPESRGRKGT